MPPTPRTRILGASLRNARVEANFGLRELARRIGVAPAMLSSWEQAHRAPSLADVAGILGAIGAAGGTKRDILRLALGAADDSWIVHGAPLSPNRATAIIAHQLAARSVVTWDPLAIPELLQIIGRQDGPRSILIEAFVSDHALHSDDALFQLAKASRSLTLRIVRADLVWRYGLTTAFDRYSIPDGEVVTYYGQRCFGVFATARKGAHSSHDTDLDRLRLIASQPQSTP